MSNLLYDERPLEINPTLAELIGLNEAIILQQVHYWIVTEMKTNDNDVIAKHMHDGKWWIWNTYEQWQEQFKFWSIATIKRTISKLEKSGLLLSGNFNKYGYDRTKWYTIDYDKLQSLKNQESINLIQWNVSSCTNGKCQNDTTNTIDYTENTSKTTHNIERSFTERNNVFSWKSFKDYNKYINNVIPEMIKDICSERTYDMTAEEITEMILYFFAWYNSCTGEYHPPYRKDLLMECIDNWMVFSDYVDSDTIKGMIEVFFERDNIEGKNLRVFSDPNMLPWLNAELTLQYNQMYY